MKKYIVFVGLIALLLGCNNKKTPDVSSIKVNLTTERFEKKLFDTTTASLTNYLQGVQATSPEFISLYLTKILGANPTWSIDTTAMYVNEFITTYRPIYNDTEKKINNFSKIETEIKQALQFVKHYFPSYKIPEKIYTYVGPADGYKAVISDVGLLIGLQSYLGKDHSLYTTDMVSQYYPHYISQTFEPDYIPVDCMKAILNTDIYLEKENDKPLVNKMIEKGKRLYILSRLLPTTDENKLIGYTEKQIKLCKDNEAIIWDFFLKNSLLQSLDQTATMDYIKETPKTQGLPDEVPGNLGSFLGWQIVKKYMDKNAAVTLQQLIALDEEKIFQEAKYKP